MTHGEPYTGAEPGMREHFFERIRPIVETALRENRTDDWPIVTLNLDFKTLEPEHLQAVWTLLGEYESWLTTAERPATEGPIAVLDVRPVLVLTGDEDEQQAAFYDRVPPGGKLRLFGAIPRPVKGAPPIAPVRTNYRRWSNNPWSVVEPEGQPKSGSWTPEDEARLVSAVRAAHDAGLWIRFYTLNGHDPADVSGGWSASYNFGSLTAAEERWRAAIKAGVDFVAVDQVPGVREGVAAFQVGSAFIGGVRLQPDQSSPNTPRSRVSTTSGMSTACSCPPSFCVQTAVIVPVPMSVSRQVIVKPY